MQSRQRPKVRSLAHLGAGAGSRKTQHSMLLLQQKSRKFRQDTSSRRCYFQKPTTLKHLLHAQLLCQAQEASVQTRAVGAHWLAAKRIGSLLDKTEAVSPHELSVIILLKEA